MMKIKNKIKSLAQNISVLFLALLFFAGCAGNKKFTPPLPVPDDQRHIERPQGNKIHPYAEYFNKQVTRQVEQSFDFARQLRNLFGKPKQALNRTAFDEVANSSWFTNRNAVNRLTLEQVKKGPNTGEGPDTSGVWTVFRAKAEGVTPGFTIKDRRGNTYLIKFDPLGYAELASGAEVVSTKLFYAAGYNVPENYVTYFHPNILRLGEKVKFTDEKGRDRFMNENDLQEILGRIQQLPDGRIRALASKYIPGRPLGPFTYQGTRKDDPNDLVPHELRRELRGLRVFCAWLNHFDTKDGNSLDSYVTENGKSYVRHFLIDFGATLGSASHGPNERWRGHQNDIDPHVIIENVVSLGFYVRPWEKLPGVKYPSIGLFEAETFRPDKYKPQVPNPAFELCTNLDAYWGAKLVMSFTDAQLRAAVETGKYANPAAAEYLFRTLIKRRDKIGHTYFNKVCPLDNFVIRDKKLRFTDMSVATKLARAEEFEYRYQLKCNQKLMQIQIITLSDPIPLPEIVPDGVNTPQLEWEFQIQRKPRSARKWGKWVRVFIRSDRDLSSFKLLGIRRQN